MGNKDSESKQFYRTPFLYKYAIYENPNEITHMAKLSHDIGIPFEIEVLEIVRTVTSEAWLRNDGPTVEAESESEPTPAEKNADTAEQRTDTITRWVVMVCLVVFFMTCGALMAWSWLVKVVE